MCADTSHDSISESSTGQFVAIEDVPERVYRP